MQCTSNIHAQLPASDLLTVTALWQIGAFPLKDYLYERISDLQTTRRGTYLQLQVSTFLGPFNSNIQDTSKMEDIVLACCALHNYLWTKSCDLYIATIVDQEGPDHDSVPGRWRQDTDLQEAHTTNATTQAEQHRDGPCYYFNFDI